MSERAQRTADRKTAQAILRYLNKYPEAKDTLDGIAEWWLRREPGKRSLGDVKRAISELVSRGLIVETRRKGLPPYYKLNPQQLAENSPPRAQRKR